MAYAGRIDGYIQALGKRPGPIGKLIKSGLQRERGVEGVRLYQQLSCLNLGG